MRDIHVYLLDHHYIYLCKCGDPPGALATAANGVPATDAVGVGTSVMPDRGTVWLAGTAVTGAELLGELAPGVAIVGEGVVAGEEAAGVAGMSYFCSCSK